MLVDWADAMYIDPCYLQSFEQGKGFKLLGDTVAGDLGLFANATHPDYKNISQNARFDIDRKRLNSVFHDFDSDEESLTGSGKKRKKKRNCYMAGQRAEFPIIAIHDINKGDEIIVNYGQGYWSAVEKWEREGCPERSRTAADRDKRAMKRLTRIRAI